MTFWESIIRGILTYLVTIGAVWFGAWIFNPSLTSGTVTFIGFVCGIVINTVRADTYEARRNR